jgi:hypothetical protein
MAEVEGFARRDQRVEDVRGEFGGNEEFPAQFADERDPVGPYPRIAEVDFAAGPEGKASLEKSAGLTAASKSRDFGPMTASAGRPEVTSTAKTCASSGMCRLSQAMSRRCEDAMVTTMNEVSDRRVMVTSASIPPRGLSHWV